MRIVVNRDLCSGHARCNAVSEELFTLDENGYSDVTEREVPPGREDEARHGASNCPERCISVVEGDG